MPNDNSFSFYHDHFKNHVQRIFDYQKDRMKLCILSIAGTLGYFGWVFANKESLSKAASLTLILFLPAILNSFGLVYNAALHHIINRHAGFLDHLEKKLFPNAKESEWNRYRLKTDKDALVKKPILYMSYLFWVVMIAISAVVAFVGLK